MTFRKEKILIADVSETFIMYMAIILKRMGFQVVPAENGAELLKLLKITEPDLILLDLNMPVLDGLSLLAHIKNDKDSCNIPVVMVSVDASEKSISKCKSLGCSGYLTKPVQLNKLNDVLQQCIFTPMGFRRNHIRAYFNQKVTVTFQGETYNLYSETVSSGGMYIRTQNPFPIGSEVGIRLPAEGGENIQLRGHVIYVKGLFGDVFKISPGMAVEFADLDEETGRKISDLVIKQLAGDIIDSQEENIIDTGQLSDNQ